MSDFDRLVRRDVVQPVVAVAQMLGKRNVSETQIAAREAAICGAPPRIAPLTEAEAGEAAVAFAASLREATPAAASVDVPEVVLTMLRHPDLNEWVSGLSKFLLGKGRLPARARQLAILRITWLWGAPFPWGEHVAVSKLAGLESDEIERIIIGSAGEGWSAEDRAILQAAEELFADGMISDETWAALADFLDDRQLMELPAVAGQFTTVSFLMNSIRARQRPGKLGLRAR